MMLVARGHGPVVFGKAIDVESAASLIPARSGTQFVVLGSLVEGGVHVDVWDLEKRDRLLEIDVRGGPQDLGRLAGRLLDEVASGLSRRGLVSERPALNQYRLPPDNLRTGYLLSLEQLLYQVLAANQVVSQETFWNERGFFETHVGLVEAWPDAPLNARMIAICGVLAAARYKSTMLEPYRKIVLRWVDEAPSSSPIARLAPAIFKRLGEEQKLANWLKAAPRIQDATYAEWLGRIQGEG